MVADARATPKQDMASLAEGGDVEGCSKLEFAPIRTDNQQAAQPSSAASVASLSIGRVRSNNGHGCADLGDRTDSSDAAAQDIATEKSPFEVNWDNDQDPLCPRSMSRLHKWIIVVIVAAGSLCV
jgi:hypothetical protein